jgi:protein-disulfide isomerase
MKKSSVILTLVIAIAGFIAAGYFYDQTQQQTTLEKAQKVAIEAAANAENNPLVRPHSPILGRVDAPVTIVEFLDPSCESCRAAFPFVHEILKKYPDDVRLVIRYAPFHQGSDVAVGILEAARKQNMFEKVLSALFDQQPLWAAHHAPDLNRAWDIARANGLDLEQAKVDAASPDVAKILQQDLADIQTNGVRATPTFFVNGKPVLEFGAEPLNNMVADEVQKLRSASSAAP